METHQIQGIVFPRHPTFAPGKLEEVVRLRYILDAVYYARTHCTTRERPTHFALCRIEATVMNLLATARETPPPIDQTLPWESPAALAAR